MGQQGFSGLLAHQLGSASPEFFPVNYQFFYAPAAVGYLRPGSPPSRTLLLSMVPASVTESAVRGDLEVFGDVRAVQMEWLRQGLVTVHYYDVRNSQAALAAVQDQYMQQQLRVGGGMKMPAAAAARGLIDGLAVWAQFVTPVTGGFPDGNNQGTLVVFNLDAKVSDSCLRGIFQAFGPVKELRESPNKRNLRFVEFYDVRDAAKAMAKMNGKEIHGNKVGIEFSWPGGHCKKFFYRPGPIHAKLTTLARPDLCDTTSSSSLPLSSSGKAGGRTSKQQRSCRGGGGRRYGRKVEPDSQFQIEEDVGMELGCKDSRTTLMIKNIPNKYGQKLVLNMLDNHCIQCNEEVANGGGGNQPLSSFDFVYLPIDFMNKCNVGYGFVNMTSPEGALRLYKAFHHRSWEVFNSRKICQVTYARLQGLEALREHFKNCKFSGEDEEYLPVVFSPPRDGRVLTEALPIVGRRRCNEVRVKSEGEHVERSGSCSYDESGRTIINEE